MTALPHLKRFVDPIQLQRVQRPFLTRLLERHQDCLPPQAAALLGARLSHEEYCAAWAAHFRSPGTLGAPLLQALSAIETLALPQNSALLEDALSHLPPGYEVNRNFPPLNQALHLWLITQAPLGVPWPLPLPGQLSTTLSEPASTPNHDCPAEAPAPAAELTTQVSRLSAEVLPTKTDLSAEVQLTKPGLPAEVLLTKAGQLSWQVTPITDEDDFRRLALLSLREYERVRKAEAKRLHLRTPTLDQLVNQARDQLEEAAAAKVFQDEIEPWPEPITDAPTLFDAVHGRYTAYAWLQPGAATVGTMFVAHCHAFPAFHYTPRLNIRADHEDCGKSTVLKIIASLVPRPFHIQNLRPSTVYRVVDFKKDRPTVITVVFDEVENCLPLYRELLGLLNAGNSSDVCVPRCEGKKVRLYKPFAPVVLAGIGDLFRTLRSRSIVIHMTQAPEGANLTRFDPDHLEIEKELRRKLARWAADNLKQIAACDPPLPKSARNRLADNWRPLFQIAHVIGGHWPQLALEAFTALTATPSVKVEAEDVGRALLEDIRRIFAQSGSDRVTSSDLVIALCALPNSRWQQAREGKKPIDQRWLARQLRPFGIEPRNIRFGKSWSKGYAVKDFA